MNIKEKSNMRSVKLLVILLLLLIPFAALRLAFAEKKISSKEISIAVGKEGKILDREGGIIYDGFYSDNYEKDIFGNLLGGNNLNNNTLCGIYSDKLCPGDISFVRGVREFGEKEWSSLSTSLLPASDQRKIADAFAGHDGCCFSYNYKTGEVYTALSFPCGVSKDDENGEELNDGSLLNKCINGTYIPGSTMKLPALICAIEQNKKLIDHVECCSGSKEIEDEELGSFSVQCTGCHGEIGISKALAYSCNCWFSGMIKRLDVEKANDSLERMGFNITKGKRDILLDFKKSNSSTVFNDLGCWEDVWSLMGQGSTTVNLIDLAVIYGAAANKGKSSMPHIAESVLNPDGSEKENLLRKTKELELFDKKSAEELCTIWEKAMEINYRSGENACNREITYAKTGTAQVSETKVNKLVAAVSEEHSAVMVIVVEDFRSGSPTPISIANLLAEMLP